MRLLQEGTLQLAKLLMEILPNDDNRHRALASLQSTKIFGEAAIKTGRTILKPEVLREYFARVENKDDLVARIWMNAFTYSDLRKYAREEMDFETQAALLKTGLQGYIWGAEVRTTRKIEPGFIVLIGSKEAEEGGNMDLTPDWKPAPDQLIRL